MEISKEILRGKINRYRSQEISKNELGKWAMEAYYALMKGEYIEIEKISVYHFLRDISTFHREPDDIADEYPCEEARVLEIGDILNGEKNIQYTFSIKISQFISQKICQKQYNELMKMQGIICELNSADISSDAVCYLEEYVNRDMSEMKTLLDLLELHIRGILIEHLTDNIDIDESISDHRQSVGIYVGAGDMVAMKKTFLPNLKKFLECALGQSSFRISIVYNKGIPTIALAL